MVLIPHASISAEWILSGDLPRNDSVDIHTVLKLPDLMIKHVHFQNSPPSPKTHEISTYYIWNNIQNYKNTLHTFSCQFDVIKHTKVYTHYFRDNPLLTHTSRYIFYLNILNFLAGRVIKITPSISNSERYPGNKETSTNVISITSAIFIFILKMLITKSVNINSKNVHILIHQELFNFWRIQTKIIIFSVLNS